MADQRTMAELLRAPTMSYAEAIVVPPILAELFELKHSLINMMTSDQFFELEKENPHDHIRWFNKITSTIKYNDVPNSAIKLMLFPFSLTGAARRRLEKEPPRSILTWEDLVSKFINEFFPPQERQIFEMKFPTFNNSLMNPTPPPSSVKAVEETCVTYGGAHLYYQCLAVDGNTFLKFRNNIQGYVSAAAVNYNQGNSCYRPPGVANQIRPSGFAQPNVQNNQNRFSQPQGYNRGNNFNQDSFYQAPIQQNQVVPLSELEKIKKMNEINIKAMQTQINNVKNELRNEMKTLIQASMSNQTNKLKNMMASFFQMNIASTSGSGPLPSNTIANPKGELKAISTRSGLVRDGPSILMPHLFINPDEDERVEETLTNPELDEFTIKVLPPLVQKAKPPSQRNYVVHQRDPLHPNIPYPSRKMLKALLSNKEKLLELANTPLNENCSAVILKKLPEKLGDRRKFLISCGFSELKCKALADLGASINLIPLSVWENLGLPELISTRMILELANRAIYTPAGIARDVFVSVGKFIFPANFIIVDHESDPRVPLILGRPFLQTARALIDVHGEEIILRDDYILEDSVDKDNLANPNVNLIDAIPEMFTDEHTLDYSSPPLYDEYDDDLFGFESNNDDSYNDPFDSEEDKIKESKLLIYELDPLRSSYFLPSLEYDSFLFEVFSEVDALPSTNNEDKVFNLDILIHENLSEVTIHIAPDKNVKKIAISHASLILEDFNPPLYELPFHKEVHGSETLLSFSFENEEKVFKPEILTSKGVHTSLLPELSHRGPKAFKVTKIVESPMEIFPCSYGEDIHILDVPCLHFYPP
uniref:Reverse transcriptase domain-containing protein n=1 Tax=Tanacetum cinerariifolium TaxID=118510 RepID=A0A699HQN2_TANCI|nr:hypothetical protein [Tanacetum cinerariifolium]